MSKTRIRIVLEIDVEDEVVPGYGDLRTAVHYTLADALGEFRSARIPVGDYVEKRYGESDAVSKSRKVGEVAARIRLAEALRQAINEPQAIEVRP